MTNQEKQAIFDRFRKASKTALDEAQFLKFKIIADLLFTPGGQDFIKAAGLLSEIGF